RAGDAPRRIRERRSGGRRRQAGGCPARAAQQRLRQP
ncbi:hypothetical protein, partial [Paenibacillus sp. 598K]